MWAAVSGWHLQSRVTTANFSHSSHSKFPCNKHRVWSCGLVRSSIQVECLGPRRVHRVEVFPVGGVEVLPSKPIFCLMHSFFLCTGTWTRCGPPSLDHACKVGIGHHCASLFQLVIPGELVKCRTSPPSKKIHFECAQAFYKVCLIMEFVKCRTSIVNST